MKNIAEEDEEPVVERERINQEDEEDEDEEDEDEEDRISQLPDAILHSILSLLTLKESCITTALSKRWRPIFPSLPRLSFDEDSLSYSSDSGEDVDIERWLSAVGDVLESRASPVKICTIDSRYFSQPYAADFINIIRFLVENGIEQLALHNCSIKQFSLPSFIYSSRSLTDLDLHGCAVAVPSEFSGLGRLRSITMEECVVSDDDLSRILSRCRSIERLRLGDCCKIKNLVVCSPKMRSLYVSTHRPLAVRVSEAPNLTSATVKFSYDRSYMHQLFHEEDDDPDGDTADWSDDSEADDADDQCEISRLLGLLKGLRDVQSLSLAFDSRCLQLLTSQRVHIPITLASCGHCLSNLKKLTLRLLLNNKYLVSIVSCLLNSCPRLEHLIMGDIYSNESNHLEIRASDHWDEQMPSDCMRNHLSQVVLYPRRKYYMHWIKFAKFLLLKSYALKEMIIIYDPRGEEETTFIDFKRELLLLQPDSLNAMLSLEFKQSLRGMPYF